METEWKQGLYLEPSLAVERLAFQVKLMWVIWDELLFGHNDRRLDLRGLLSFEKLRISR